jgi:hypothetical protein
MAESPCADWSILGDGAHAVQFYSSDGQLLDLLATFVGKTLVSDDAALVVTIGKRRQALARRLAARGFDVGVPTRQGRYAALDAQETLWQLMRDGRPDADRFHTVIGGVIGRLSRSTGRHRVAVFGEMVALLWQQGKHQSALRLEHMWNDLAQRQGFALCCAYPRAGFGTQHEASFMRICAQHSHVFTMP